MTAPSFGRCRVTSPLTAARATVAAAVLVGALAACGVSHSSSPSASPPPAAALQQPLGDRSLPAFLPTTTAPVDRVVTASASHPQLATQGVGVQVDLPSGGVLATITGPHVPPFVTPPPPQVTATFDISLTHATGSVPVRLSEFTITDQLGRTFRPSLVAHEAAPPSTVAAGRTVTFQVTAAMPSGEGRITWSPGGRPTVTWDFIVEND